MEVNFTDSEYGPETLLRVSRDGVPMLNVTVSPDCGSLCNGIPATLWLSPDNLSRRVVSHAL